MDINVQRFQSKPFCVDAIHVTAENFEECAKWCGSTMANDPEGRYIRVRVNKPASPRRTKAFVGDWILYSESYGYKVYTDGAFTKLFAPVTEVANA